MTRAILAIDCGTTASKAAVVSLSGKILGLGRIPLVTRFGAGGSAHQDPEEIISTQSRAIDEAVAGAGRVEILAAGITSQRSTFVIWDTRTGRSLAPAPTWQDTSAGATCSVLRHQAALVRRLTGLPLSAHYSASKIPGILRQARGARGGAEGRSLAFGPVATWLLWRLTKQRLHATDPTQAARTLLMNLSGLRWDDRLLSMFGVPGSILPVIRPGIGSFGTIRAGAREVPVLASLGDQQAALFSLTDCESRGGAGVVNYGTGAFVLIPTGRRVMRRRGLLTSVSWNSATDQRYLLEGTVNAAGATLDWLRRELGAPERLEDVDALCRDAKGECLMLPAYWGLGSIQDGGEKAPPPSVIVNAEQERTLSSLTRAAVESLAFMVNEIIRRVAADQSCAMTRIVLTGPLSRVGYLARFQAALSAPLRVEVSEAQEATLTGIARAAAFGAGGALAEAASRWVPGGRRVRPAKDLARSAADRQRQWMRLLRHARALGDGQERRS